MNDRQPPSNTQTPIAATPTTMLQPGTLKFQQQMLLLCKTILGLSARQRKDSDTTLEHITSKAPPSPRPAQKKHTSDKESTREKVQGVTDRYKTPDHPASHHRTNNENKQTSIHTPNRTLDSTKLDPQFGDKRNRLRSISDMSYSSETNNGNTISRNTIPVPAFAKTNISFKKDTQTCRPTGYITSNTNTNMNEYTNQAKPGSTPPPPPNTKDEANDQDTQMTNKRGIGEHKPHNKEQRGMYIDEESGLEYAVQQNNEPTSKDEQNKQVTPTS